VEEITQSMVETISGVPLNMPGRGKSTYSKRQAVNHALADALVDQELVSQIKSVYMQNDLKILAMTWNMG